MASAQVKSCVLIAGMLADGSTTVVEPGPSRDHTERLMRRAHVPFQSEKGRLTVTQVDEIELDEVVVPGDPSSAAFIVAAAMLVPGSRVVVSGMGLNWTRTAFFRIVRAHGRRGRVRARGARHGDGHRADRRARRGVRRRSRAPRWGPTRCRWRSTS